MLHALCQVWPETRETLEASCDIGSTPDRLKQDFPDLDFDHLSQVWW
jgi:hypothetical protein